MAPTLQIGDQAIEFELGVVSVDPDGGEERRQIDDQITLSRHLPKRFLVVVA